MNRFAFVWQVTSFDISANLAERSLNATATLNAKKLDGVRDRPLQCVLIRKQM